MRVCISVDKMANVPFRHASAQDRRFRMDSLRDRLLPPTSATTEKDAVIALIQSDKTWLLLPFAFIGIITFYTNCSPGTVFILNFLGMIPLARLLGDSTEELAAGLRNETAGALLNATFGNAVEMIITYQTISAGLVTVAKSSLLGSILSNLLLVLGTSFFFGGIGRLGKQQEFQESGPLVSMSMLLLTCVGFAVPTVVENVGHVEVMNLSRVSALSILLSYVALLVYQLYTHRKEFETPVELIDENESATMSIKTSTGMLLISTLMTACCSNCIVSCIEGVVVEWNLSQAFIGVVLLPIIGNACEHVSAVRMAIHEKPLLSIGIAVGSSCQIAMFVIPLAVIFGWIMGVPMDLNFEALNVVILAFAVIIVTVIIVDGKSTWIEGFMLIVVYFIVAAAYWFDSTNSTFSDIN
jgi:Ca2+:H+ antiporter